jgi:hypothetical protein
VRERDWVMGGKESVAHRSAKVNVSGISGLGSAT